MGRRKKAYRQTPQLLILGITLSAISLLPTQPSLAQKSEVPPPSNADLDLSLLQPGASVPTGSGIVTANTIKQGELTVPSLWWAREQSVNKLLDNWIAYPAQGNEPARVDLVVNPQVWTILDYLERYDFVNRVGTVARDYSYNVRVFNYNQDLLATYTCNFSTAPALCNIRIDGQIREQLQRFVQQKQ